MAKQTKLKTLSYRRGEWLESIPKGYSLETYVSLALRKLKTVEDRTIIRSSGQHVRCIRKLEPQAGGIFLHLTADTPGEKASIVPTVAKSVEETEVRTASPPKDAEFMDGDAFLYIQKDHVCICTTVLRDGAIRSFLYAFFDKAGLGEASTQFDLMKIANVSKLRLLRTQGVKEIDLRATLFAATTHYEKRKNEAGGLLRDIGRKFASIVKADKPDSDDSLRITITIKTDERVQKQLQVGEKKIEKLAENIVKNEQDDDEYVIHTKAGMSFGAQEIFIREGTFIEALGKSVKRDRAWESLRTFYANLEKGGILGH